MLRSFRFANHKSFRDEAELLLMPAYDKSRPVVPVATIFGANASGKSNLLDALHWMQTAVRESYALWEPGVGVPRTPFRLDPAARNAPSLYCVEITIEGDRYTYGVEVNDQRVTEEWLYTYPHNRRRLVFERAKDHVRLGSTVADYRVRGEQLARQTRDNALFLSVAAHNALSEVQSVYQWFRAGTVFVNRDAMDIAVLLQRLRDERQRMALVSLIRAADLGIMNITVTDGSRLAETLRIQEEYLDRAVDPASTKETRDFMQEIFDILVRAESRSGLQLRFMHGTSDEALTLEEQSSGTQSWIGLVSAALGALGGGALMTVDEVDASLHPHLVARLINLFRDAETNPHGAQLLLTTHDATLLDEETLSRDEVWFVEKEPDAGSTKLYPLTDFHPRKNENTEGRYLAGGYGAIPVLSDYEFRKAARMDWDDSAAA